VLLAATLAAAGCGASPALIPTPAPTETPAPAAGNLPPGCDPIDLRTPSGGPVSLDGTWTEEVAEGSPGVTWWIRTRGDCVWGASKEEVVASDPFADTPDSVQNLRGQIRTDFVIEGEIVLLGPSDFFMSAPIYAPVRILIEFDDAGEIVLREDRVYGVQGPRCVDPSGYCRRPFVLRLQTAFGN
jgi:hypothetical protein